LGDAADRDSVEGIFLRLSFLTGYLEGRAKHERTIDITPDPEGEYETAGNLVCLPGVNLASVLHNDGSDPGPTAA